MSDRYFINPYTDYDASMGRVHITDAFKQRIAKHRDHLAQLVNQAVAEEKVEGCVARKDNTIYTGVAGEN